MSPLMVEIDPKHPCELCGGEMKVERRMPGSGPGRLMRERRSAPTYRSRAPLTG